MVFGPKWTRGEPTEWVLHENVASLSGDSFTIKNGDTGDVVINANAANFSLKDNITLSDAETGEEICAIKEEKMHTAKTYKIWRGGDCVATARKDRVSVRHTIRIYEGNAEFNSLTNSTSAECLLQLHGGMIMDRNTEIYKGNTEDKVAYSHEKRTNLGGLFGQDEYEVRIEPGTDIVLVLASMIIKDEISED